MPSQSEQTHTYEYKLRSSKRKFKNVHKLENLGHTDLVLFVYLRLIQMHICIKYIGSMIGHLQRGRCGGKKRT